MEFDGGGFSAVASFFGKEGTGSSNDATTKDAFAEKRKQSKPKNRRLGLGAETLVQKKEELSLEEEETRKKILSIGKKKRKFHGDNESDEEDEKELVEDDSDDDEGEGRTTAVKTKKPQSSLPPPSPLLMDPSTNSKKNKKKKKKKAGKKERLAKMAEADEKENEELNTIPVDKDTAEEKMVETTAETSDANANDATVQDDDKNEAVPKDRPSSKRKRRKIRSKQKNIRKDNRTTAEKPEHLRKEKNFYSGRPLTKETRTFMNMPQSRTVTLKQQKEKYGDSNKEKEAWDATDSGLGIDDMMTTTEDASNDASNENADADADGVPTVEKPISNPTSGLEDSGVIIQETKKEEAKPTPTITKKKKTKKSKYKNLK